MAEYVGFIGSDYTSRSLRANSERTINLYPEKIEDGLGKSKMVLYGTPGLTLAFTCGTGPVWAMWTDTKGLGFYVVSGPAATPHLYLIQGNPAAWTVLDQGVITNTNPVTDAGHTTPFVLGNSTQLLIAGGLLHGAVWNLPGGPFGGLDSGNVGQAGWPRRVSSGCIIDGYGIVNAGINASGVPGYTNSFFISGLNTLATWAATDFGTESDGPDGIVCVAALRRDLWLFGMRRTVIYYDSGASGFPFTRIPGAVLDLTCMAPRTVCEAEGSLFFLGGTVPGDIAGLNATVALVTPSFGTSVYRTKGYDAERISTHSIEKIIGAWPDPCAAHGFMYQDGGHTFYVLNGHSGAAVVFDLQTGLWHERVSTATGQVAGAYDPQCYAHYEGLHLVGSANTGKVYSMDTATLADTGNAITRTRIGPPISAQNRYNFFHRFTLDLEIGTQASGAQNITLAWSDDGGQTFPMTKTVSVGAPASYLTRVFFNRLGKSRDRVFKVTTTDQIQAAWLGAFLEMTPGKA